MTSAKGILARLFVAGVVAIVVIGVSGVAPLLSGGGGGGVAAGPDHPAWSADALAPDRMESTGEADPSGDVGTVAFDASHGNRFQQEDVRSLTKAIESAGGDVRFEQGRSDMAAMLQDVDVLVVADPATPYNDREMEAIEQFVDDGGRLLILAEPNRNAINQQGLGASLMTQRSRVTRIGSSFDVSFGSEYLYDMENNDGNFKNIVTSPPSGTDHATVEGVDEVSMYTAASVHTTDGTVVLRTAPTAEHGNEVTDSGFPVAVVAGDGNVMAVGDTTFLHTEYDTVADNDVFVQRIVEFMAEADHQPSGSAQGPDMEDPPNPSLVRPTA